MHRYRHFTWISLFNPLDSPKIPLSLQVKKLRPSGQPRTWNEATLLPRPRWGSVIARVASSYRDRVGPRAVPPRTLGTHCPQWAEYLHAAAGKVWRQWRRLCWGPSQTGVRGKLPAPADPGPGSWCQSSSSWTWEVRQLSVPRRPQGQFPKEPGEGKWCWLTTTFY